MIENRAEQVEALETLKEYNVKIVKALGEVTDELKGNKKQDTDAYLDEIFKGVNWELQVINATIELLNEKENQVSKEDINKIVNKINDAYASKDDNKMAQVLDTELYPFFKGLGAKVENVL